MTQPSAYQVGPFSQSHVYVQWGGKLPGNEIWSCGFRMINVGTIINDTERMNTAAAMLQPMATAISAYHTNGITQIGSGAKLSFVKVNVIKTDGRYMSQDTNEVILADLSGAGVVKYPNQIALVTSLITQFSRGPAHRGRFYNPLPSGDVLSDGRIAAAVRDGVATQGTALVNAVNNVDAARWRMAVMSRKAGAPNQNLVTGVQVGRVLDTQRRRRNRLVESYI